MRIGVGSYSGNQESLKIGSDVLIASESSIAFGGQAGLGADIILGRHFLAEISFGYNLMSNFNRSIGGSNNYSGPESCLGISYLFGRP